MEQFFYSSCWLLSVLKNVLSFMECEGSLHCSQGLASDPVLSLLKVTALFHSFTTFIATATQ